MRLSVLPVLLLCVFIEAASSQVPVEYKVNHKIPVQKRPNGQVIVNATRNHLLTIYAYDLHYDCFKVKYKDHYGIISPEALVNDAFWDEVRGNLSEKKHPDTALVISAKMFLVEKISNFSAAGSAETDQKRVELIRKYGYTDGINIADSKVWIGMTVDMAIDSWGIPYRVKRTRTTWGVQEQWLYSHAYLYFDNGILSEIFRFNHRK